MKQQHQRITFVLYHDIPWKLFSYLDVKSKNIDRRIKFSKWCFDLEKVYDRVRREVMW